MRIGGESPKWVVVIIFAAALARFSLASVCELGYSAGNKLFNFNLAAASLPNFPYGVLSEDGFYKVTVNQTVLWFQLCDGMIFNHDPPRCVDCLDCGGASRCGMECSALIANNWGGYQVCTTIGHLSSTQVKINDEKNPQKGVTISMSSTGMKRKCSLTVSVFCDTKSFEGPNSVEILGDCKYTEYVGAVQSMPLFTSCHATSMRHPAACATIISDQRGGLGWFGTFMLTTICLFGAYLLAGAVYRYFFLGVHGVEIIPNLEFWATIPHRTQNLLSSLIWRFRGSSVGSGSSYSPVDF